MADMDEQPAVDFFIAHASADREYAERLYALLATRSRPFLDSRSLALGQPWDDQLQAALGRARVTVVLVSPHADQAYYLREEIAQAIDRARHGSHQVVPVPGVLPCAANPMVAAATDLSGVRGGCRMLG